MLVKNLDRRNLLLLGLLAPSLASCTALEAFNALVPYDHNSRLAATDIAFGTDERQRLDIYTPNLPTGSRPVVLFIYGGSWNDGTKSDYGFVGHALASQGFVTVIADYRLVPQVQFPAFIDDAALATAWITSNISAFGGDRRAIFVMGHSAGAYNAAMVALDKRYVRRAGIAGQPFRGLIGLAGPYDFLPFDVKATRDAFGQWPKPAETQPVLVVGDDRPSAFLATGAADETVRPRNTINLSAALRRHGAEVQEHIYDGLGHGSILTALARPLRGRAPVLDDVVSFIRRESA